MPLRMIRIEYTCDKCGFIVDFEPYPVGYYVEDADIKCNCGATIRFEVFADTVPDDESESE